MASGPFLEAYTQVENVRDFVTETLEQQIAYANSTRASVSAVLDALKDFDPQTLSAGPSPSAPSINTSIDGNFDLPEISATSFGTVTSEDVERPNLDNVRDAPEVDIAPFMPSVTSLNIPEAPDFTAPLDAPPRPDLLAIDIPAAPILDKPAFPSLEPITIPTFDFPTLPTFSSTAPEFEGTPVSNVLQWTERPYAIEVLDEMIAKLRDIWNGENGIPPAVENAMWERAAGREDLDTSRQVSQAMLDFSSRGFTEPPGMLTARIDAIREESQIKKNALNREQTIKMAELQVENVRFACEQSVAAENVLVNIWNNTAQRQFEAARVQLDSQLALYNAQVALFNARQQAYATDAQVFRVRLEGELARIEVFKAQLEGEVARGQLNEQQVRIYAERVRALLTDVEVYKAVMEGASIQSDVNKNIIDGYRADIQAYAARIDADKSRFDAYDSRIKGELGKAQILDAEARGYASYVSGQSTVADIGIKRMEADIRKNELLIRQYVADLENVRTKISADVATIEASARAYVADTQRYSAQASAEEARSRVDLAAKESEIRVVLGLYEVEVRKYLADTDLLIKQAQVQLEALRTAGSVGSTLAAGAMAGINIGANLSGGSTVGATGNYGEQKAYSYNKAKSFGVNVAANSPTIPADPTGDWL
jgi:hypothetical protein